MVFVKVDIQTNGGLTHERSTFHRAPRVNTGHAGIYRRQGRKYNNGRPEVQIFWYPNESAKSPYPSVSIQFSTILLYDHHL